MNNQTTPNHSNGTSRATRHYSISGKDRTRLAEAAARLERKQEAIAAADRVAYNEIEQELYNRVQEAPTSASPGRPGAEIASALMHLASARALAINNRNPIAFIRASNAIWMLVVPPNRMKLT